jgi:hypothetical protein
VRTFEGGIGRCVIVLKEVGLRMVCVMAGYDEFDVVGFEVAMMCIGCSLHGTLLLVNFSLDVSNSKFQSPIKQTL